ncbi:helix-turn-helix transcriptional regulator [Parahaliea aestuarii]|nr:AlpA family phage regulatory protein [Parahaliea aestuarii]
MKRLEETTGLKQSRLYELVSEGAFPPPVKLGRASAWVSTEVQQWIADRIAERDGGTPE